MKIPFFLRIRPGSAPFRLYIPAIFLYLIIMIFWLPVVIIEFLIFLIPGKPHKQMKPILRLTLSIFPIIFASKGLTIQVEEQGRSVIDFEII